ncbi:transmembrane protein 62-like [Macrosteles quadrilineatus]|uniref:transmembrane protein 62-like n=1 Tax=Macrosteles quadrilineatus TaxID=74068 RepID=UPI0023E31CC5|nr:transmembrane protein 62-like [Macrosteles quadrilineatus]
MRISLTKILIVAIIVVISVVIGNISTIIKLNPDPSQQLTSKKSEINVRSTGNSNWTTENPLQLLDDITWFLQVSDIHVSIFREIDRINELEEFCKLTISTIRPTVVLATGDLTDAKSVDTLGSRQYEDEWKLYKNALDRCEVTKKTVWLDVRGNHDNFNVPGPSSKENYFRNYSIQGRQNPRSYLYTVRNPNGRVISFIALDACLEPGPKRPFNFFGLLNQREREHVSGLMAEAASLNSSHSVWFGHYPTSCILSADKSARELIASETGSMAYLCGHLHTLGGLMPAMYTRQQAGFLELELGDWKNSRVYRLAAIDHGTFSFVDVHHHDWPLVLVTNPKHALFHIPGRESQQLVNQIRILAFSTAEITEVRVKIDDSAWWKCSHVKGPLYVTPWDPELYYHGLHHIYVEVQDGLGRLKNVKQPFSLDGTEVDFDIWPRILLMSNITTVLQTLFGLSILGCVVPLSLLRLLMSRVRGGHRLVPTTSVSLIRRWYKRWWILANLDSFYYPLVLYPVYTTFGPWAVGEVIENHIGVIFAWGTFVNGAYLPGSFTYGYGFFQMVTFQFPLTMVLAYKLDKRLNPPSPTYGKIRSLLCHWWTNLPFYIILFLQLLFLYFFWLSYGSLAVLLGPFRSWPILNTWLFWNRLHSIPLQRIKETANIFEEVNKMSSSSKNSHCI